MKSPSDYAKEARSINQNHSLSKLKIAFLSSYTIEIIKSYVAVELANIGYLSEQYFAPFNQFEQEVYNSDSELYKLKPDFIIIHMRIEDVYPDISTRFIKYNDDELEKIEDSILGRYSDILLEIRKKTKSKIIIFDFADGRIKSDLFYSSELVRSFHVFLQNLNNKLYDLCSKVSSCHVVNYQQIISNFGLSNWGDLKLYYMAKIPFNVNAQIKIAKILSRTINAVVRIPIKCIVLDLDNTLWGGVIGEDGLLGIQLGNNYPGNVFKDFQKTLLGLRDQGILLAIASKNNIKDVVEVFEKNTDCVLKMNDFSAIQVHWDDKAKSIERISQELNIGLDSIVFFDDNPVERLWIQEQLPDVKIIDVPDSPIGYIGSLIDSSYFDSLHTTKEDKDRHAQYKQQVKRSKLYKNSKTIDDFLKNLKMKVNIGHMSNVTINRLEQLINKTNQFNLTSKRYDSIDLEDIVSNDGMVLWVSVKDCYGDNGIVGVAIIKDVLSKKWVLDSFLLSCRIIGRKIETVFLSEIVNIARDCGAQIIKGQYIYSKNNNLVSSFYKNHNFKLSDKDINIWEFNLDNNINRPKYIEVFYDKY
ncbi:HAD-IIIC family phosphatase [bacterium]|nr:HAD-IIIC family phosphatase [bacterium]